MKNYKKMYDLKSTFYLINSTIEKIKKINSDYDFKIIQDEEKENYIFLEKYYKKEMKNKIYNSIDTIHLYLKGIKETLQDAE